MPLWGRLFLWSFVTIFLLVPVSIVGLMTVDEILRPTPTVVRDLPPRGDDAFTTRLEARFPQGMAELDLIADLERLGFVLDTTAHRAKFLRTSLVCSHDWIVEWTVKTDGALATISGHDMGACL